MYSSCDKTSLAFLLTYSETERAMVSSSFDSFSSFLSISAVSLTTSIAILQLLMISSLFSKDIFNALRNFSFAENQPQIPFAAVRHPRLFHIRENVCAAVRLSRRQSAFSVPRSHFEKYFCFLTVQMNSLW